MGSALLDTTPLDPACFDAAGHSHAAAPALAPAPHEALRLQVSQRLAAHRDRRDRLHPQPSAEAKPIPSDTRATRIAAAVAERFAHSPSYRAFLAAEAERATQQAQAAAEVAALNAQAVAQAQQQLLESLYPVTPNDQAIADDPIPEPTLWLEPDPTPTTNPGGPSFPVLSERVGYRAQHDRTPPDHLHNSDPLHFTPHSGSTSIFLAPGHRFRIVSGLLTNFHLPESTLLMLVSAFAGDTRVDLDRGRQTILRAYAHAIEQRYRFYSYGDCMLIL